MEIWVDKKMNPKCRLQISLATLRVFKGVTNRESLFSLDVTAVLLVLHYKWKFSVLQQFSLISFRLPLASNITSVVNCSHIHKSLS